MVVHDVRPELGDQRGQPTPASPSPCRPVRRGLSPPCRPGPWNGWKGVPPSSAGSSTRCGSGSPSWNGSGAPPSRSTPCARSCSTISPRPARAAVTAAGTSPGATTSSGAPTSSPSPDAAAASPAWCGPRSVSNYWSTPPSAADTAQRQTPTAGMPGHPQGERATTRPSSPTGPHGTPHSERRRTHSGQAQQAVTGPCAVRILCPQPWSIPLPLAPPVHHHPLPTRRTVTCPPPWHGQGCPVPTSSVVDRGGLSEGRPGRRGRSSAPRPNLHSDAFSARQQRFRTCPTASVPDKTWRDTWDGSRSLLGSLVTRPPRAIRTACACVRPCDPASSGGG